MVDARIQKRITKVNKLRNILNKKYGIDDGGMGYERCNGLTFYLTENKILTQSFISKLLAWDHGDLSRAMKSYRAALEFDSRYDKQGKRIKEVSK